MTEECEDCGRLFLIENRVIHLPDTDAVINITMTTAEPVRHQDFVAGIGQLYREETARYQVNEVSG